METRYKTIMGLDNASNVGDPVTNDSVMKGYGNAFVRSISRYGECESVFTAPSNFLRVFVHIK